MDDTNDKMKDSDALYYLTNLDRNPSGKFIDVGQKQMLLHMFKDLMDNAHPGVTYKEKIKIMSERSGIGSRTIAKTLSEYRTLGKISPPNRKKTRTTVYEKLRPYEKDKIHQIINNICARREIPTLENIYKDMGKHPDLPIITRSMLRRLLKLMKYVYTRKNGYRMSTLRDYIL